MNPIDKQNLRFLLESDEQTIRKWWASVDEEDKEYAMELLKFAGEQLREQSLALRIEAELALSDFSESKMILRKFCKNI